MCHPCHQVRPEFLNNWEAKLWSRFFCLSVYITMYLNDHQRSAFYESLGLNTTQVRAGGAGGGGVVCCRRHVLEGGKGVCVLWDIEGCRKDRGDQGVNTALEGGGMWGIRQHRSDCIDCTTPVPFTHAQM